MEVAEPISREERKLTLREVVNYIQEKASEPKRYMSVALNRVRSMKGKN